MLSENNDNEYQLAVFHPFLGLCAQRNKFNRSLVCNFKMLSKINKFYHALVSHFGIEMEEEMIS